MEANVYRIDGSVEKKIALPEIFNIAYNQDIVNRAVLAEQSADYQPQGRSPLAGMQTSARYIGRYGTYRTLRHTGLTARPRQMLAKGAMGQVRRIPSAVKGRRAHPQTVEKTIIERINRKEYTKAFECAIAATAKPDLVKSNHVYTKESLPIIVSSDIEKLLKTKDIIKMLGSLGLLEDINRSHKPKTKAAGRRRSQKRYFRNSVLIVVKNANAVERAGRNVPGVNVLAVDRMRVETLAPGARPRLTVWSEPAISALADGIKNSVMSERRMMA